MNKLTKLTKTYKFEFWVFVFYLITRLAGLGYDVFNTDVWKWKARIFNFGNGVFTFNFVQTIQRYHPGVTLMWLGSIAVKIYSFYYKIILKIAPPDNNIAAVFQLHFLQKLVITLAIGLTIAMIFHTLKKLFSQTYATIFVLLLTLEPFFIALTRTIHLEGLMTVFMLGSFVYFYAYITKFPKKANLVISATFGSLAFLTKTSSLFLLPFYALIIFLNRFDFDSTSKQKILKSILNKKLVFEAMKTSVKPYFSWLLLTIVFFVLFWPAMWVAPLSALTTLTSGIFETGIENGHKQFYFGRFVQNPGFSFYIVTYLLRSSVVLLFGVFTYFLITKNGKNKALNKFTLFSMLFVILYALEMTIPTKKLDRYLLPSIAGSVFVAAHFYFWLFEKLRFKSKKLITLIFVLFLTLPNIFIHPDYLSYYNPMFGGLSKGIIIIEPKWLIGKNEIMSYFEQVAEEEQFESFPKGVSIDSFVNSNEIKNKLVIAFPEKYYTQIWPFIEQMGARATIKDITAQAVNSKYFVYPVWDDTSNEENRFKIKYIDSIYVRGVPLYRVYVRK